MLAPSRPWLFALALTACGDDGLASIDASTSGAGEDTAATITTTAPDPSTAGSSSGTGDDTADTGPGADVGVPVAPVEIVIHSQRATRIDVYVYAAPTDAAEVLVRTLEHGEDDAFRVTLEPDELAAAGVGDVLYYGLRAWGPNWPEDPRWVPGSDAGFVVDVDDEGNRFNPNKLLVDPRARELSHDPITPSFGDAGVYRTGPEFRALDSGPSAPKSVHVLAPPRPVELGPRPTRALADDTIYEVHVRGFTQADASVPEACRGTYAGVAAKADYLAALGVTAIELLPVHETTNSTNDVAEGTDGDNYWGYSTLGFFAPDRRYACDDSPGGPTREFQAMVAALHERDIKVLLDVVYNHTAEGGVGDPDVAKLYSLRGLDNRGYYEIDADPGRYVDNTGVGANTNAANPMFRDLVLDSLAYWHEEMGVDGFRFDLASVLGNACDRECFMFEPDAEDGILQRAVAELPARPVDGGDGVDLIAEPWGIGAGTYQIGNFPAGFAEWNGVYRDTLRRDMNLLGVANVTPREFVRTITGSPQLFDENDRGPAASINFLVAHDGFTLHDLFACNAKDNDQPWPFGPSSGGSDDNLSWDHGGDPARQRQAARTGLVLLAASAGAPMITGGDEALRTVGCNNNPYNLDAATNWLDWTLDDDEATHAAFTTGVLQLRRDHPALRPRAWIDGAPAGWSFLTDAGTTAGSGYVDDPTRHFLAWRIDGRGAGDPARSIYVGYNGSTGTVIAHLPAPADGHAWVRVLDTAEAEVAAPGDEPTIAGDTYDTVARSIMIALEVPEP